MEPDYASYSCRDHKDTRDRDYPPREYANYEGERFEKRNQRPDKLERAGRVEYERIIND
jgi:hypothetical protein